MKRTENYFDFDFEMDDPRFSRELLRNRSILERNHECDDNDDFDFCEDACDNVTDNVIPTRQNSRKQNECECNERCECKEEKCRCRENIIDDCCEETLHCSDYKDFNIDERYGCIATEDAAQSEDDWFEHQNETCCNRCRELCEEDKCLCKKIKCRIQVLDFVLLETAQFLNTHPCDYEALRYYRIVRRKLNQLEKMYERKCGPLTNKNVDTEYGWEWACCPWPWEGKE